MKEKALTAYLKTALGAERFVRFTQTFGGTRLHIPHRMKDDHVIVKTIGREAAERISRTLAPDRIRVPLARRERALFYREQGRSDREIALALGITETGVGKLFAREANLPERPAKCRKQGELDLIPGHRA